MNNRKLFTYLCLMLALFSLGGMRRNEDPIAATAQTGAIPLKQKMEENKDGAKGAPSPSMTFYGSKQVLTSSPVRNDKTDEANEETKRPAEEESQAEFEEDDSWETDEAPAVKKDQESTENAVEDEDSWWSEDEEETPPPDEQSGSEF